MDNKVYPGSTPQFRILRNNKDEDKLQLRYVNITQGYTSLWQDVPVIMETIQDENRTKFIESNN